MNFMAEILANLCHGLKNSMQRLVTSIIKILSKSYFFYFRDFFYLPSAYISLIKPLARIYTYASIIHNTEMTFLKAILFNFYVKCQAKVVTNIFGFFYDLVFEFAPLFNNIFTKWHLWSKFLFLLFPYSIVFKCLNLPRPFFIPRFLLRMTEFVYLIFNFNILVMYLSLQIM